MILEHALLTVTPGREAEFEAAFAEARHIIAAMPGFGGLTLSRCLERENGYLLLVRWQRLEDHTEGSAARRSTSGGATSCTTSTTPSPSWSTTRRS
ncbi:hypothetical protein GCM10010531_34160 [Blastococcus jejuensis]|uniref:ABM domain-containing protein n=1 Tax=Blastococcus jejuensis TaxID=351224 RepID=A0ABP6PFN9_9ACTN